MSNSAAHRGVRFNLRTIFGVMTLVAMLCTLPSATLAIGVSLVFLYDAWSCLFLAVTNRNSGAISRFAKGLVQLLVAVAAVWAAAVILSVSYSYGDPLKVGIGRLVGLG